MVFPSLEERLEWTVHEGWDVGKVPWTLMKYNAMEWQNPWVMEDYILGLWTMESRNKKLNVSPCPPRIDSKELMYGGYYYKHEKQQKSWRCSSVVECLHNVSKVQGSASLTSKE